MTVCLAEPGMTPSKAQAERIPFGEAMGMIQFWAGPATIGSAGAAVMMSSRMDRDPTTSAAAMAMTGSEWAARSGEQRDRPSMAMREMTRSQGQTVQT